MAYYAHTTDNKDKSDWQLLIDHLVNVAEYSEKFANAFGAGKLAYTAGMVHDLGKYSKEFQERLEGKKHKVDHSTAGAKELEEKYGCQIGRVLAYVVAGHHGGLPNGNRGNDRNLLSRLEKEDLPNYSSYENEIQIPLLGKEDIKNIPVPQNAETSAFSRSFFVRMLYSCIVDADFIDTEKFMAFDKSIHRGSSANISDIFIKFENTLKELEFKSLNNATSINIERQKILQSCLEAANCKNGFYTLTVPTGGGKTYSSMAFALKHAIKNKKDRIIYVIPYTSIIEQNAQVFRDALGMDVVLEHHSNFDYPDGSYDNWSDNEKKHRLSTENWDMPIITTTAVQFFESMFSNKSSKCRKLHNIANSVVILDEAQMMPLDYLMPCLWALVELIENYSVTVVLCTATQPAIRDMLPSNINPIEIIENPIGLQKAFERVKIQYLGNISDLNIAAEITKLDQVLCIVNTRKHAKKLFEKIAELTSDGIYHLSARMCPAHRKQILAEIRIRLREKKTCRVISTQLIEAGVDVDFPVVYRAMAGIDSIAQAAGRCNREGKMNHGNVYVFEPEEHGMPKKGRFSKNASITRSIVRSFGDSILSLEAIKSYFELLYDFEREQLDAKDILKMIKEGEKELLFPFEDIAYSFNLIDDIMQTVIVPFDEEAKRLIFEMENSKYPGMYSRSLQKYSVQIYVFEREALVKAGAIGSEKVGGLYWVVRDSSFYNNLIGLMDAESVKAPNEVLLF
ncbi:CRISPR-associated helicase/endonuclease Cas3 [Pseudobacteroides cellulosolvens]|uniref:CRISPR-associated helicase Cas3 n=1 Tax=Pseudobacteroides cellulosolvens ATCC 35603 = DSM 2933 TaxID=398512 RepID=A0A0L6JNM9_9FIRM|nr:CRISPR-associated helicase/endonuclease Cas3 [Pseudobacteroides cellulosolvens]KNY27431.1 CRISPR-associated helicase Cas3 [Pseudobacteroides cellulosolvens ATCC 35603 = DSM 2933]